MTFNEAMLELYLKGLPYPSPFSVFFLYSKVGDCYRRTDKFDDNFRGLLEIQQLVQKSKL